MRTLSDLELPIFSADKNNLFLPVWDNFMDNLRGSNAFYNITPKLIRDIIKVELAKYNATLVGNIITFAAHQDKFRFMLTWG